MSEKREQVAKQWGAVSHLAAVLAEIARVNSGMVREGTFDVALNLHGHRTAYLMGVLGDALNGMDAVDEDKDGWLDPIYEVAHKMFPHWRESSEVYRAALQSVVNASSEVHLSDGVTLARMRQLAIDALTRPMRDQESKS
jgi:hypothetical protein